MSPPGPVDASEPRRRLESVPFESSDVECTLRRWVPEGCELAGGLLTVAGRYPSGSKGAAAARVVSWRLAEAMDLPAPARIDGLVVDCRELDYEWGDDLAVEPARVPGGFPVLVVLRPQQLAAFDDILQDPDRVRHDLDEALAELEERLREIEDQRAMAPEAPRRRPGERVEAWLSRGRESSATRAVR